MWRASSPSSGCHPHRATTAACSRCSARSGPNACAPPVHHAILSEDVVTVAGMATAEDRVGMLEVRVRTLETWAGPGQTEALAEGQRKIRADLAKIQKTQDRHSRLLGRLTSDVDILQGDVAGLKGDVAGLKGDVAGLKGDVAGLRADVEVLKGDVAGLRADVEVLKGDVAGLKADVEVLKGDVAGLKADVAGLKADVAGLKADFAGLKADVAELRSDMAEVKGTLQEILRRLPPGPG